jgi:putative DNA primase/helicase
MAEAREEIGAMLRAARAKPNGQWPSLIDITAQTVPTFPVRMLPHPFCTFVDDIADRLQAPPDFIAIPLLVAAATMLGREWRIAPKRHDDWTERPCLWGVVIGNPGSMKSPASTEATRHVRKMQAEAWERYKLAHKEWMRRQQQAGEGDDHEPTLDALIVNDTTVEALVKTLAQNPRGVMLYRDELSGWFAGMNKYRKGAGDDLQFFLECWSGGAHRVDRIGRPPVYIDDLYLSIFGTIQPETMHHALHSADRDGRMSSDGMMARFGLAAWPDTPDDAVELVDRRPDSEARKAVEERLRSMRAAIPFYESPPLRFSGMAYALFNRWYLRNINRPERQNGGFGAHIAKYPALFARLAVTLHLMQHGAMVPDEIGIETASAAQTIIDDYLELHARKIYGLLEAHPARAGAARIALWLRDKHVERFTERDVRRHDWQEFNKERDVAAIVGAMQMLEAYGWITIVDRPTTVRGGRPTREAIVNPAVIGAETPTPTGG